MFLSNYCFFSNFRLYKYFFLDYLILFDRNWLFTSFCCSWVFTCGNCLKQPLPHPLIKTLMVHLWVRSLAGCMPSFYSFEEYTYSSWIIEENNTFASLFFGGWGGGWEVMFKNVTFLAYKCFVMENNNWWRLRLVFVICHFCQVTWLKKLTWKLQAVNYYVRNCRSFVKRYTSWEGLHMLQFGFYLS